MGRLACLVIMLLGLVAAGHCQPGMVAIYYFDEHKGSNPALGCPCNGGTPFRDSTQICVWRDVNDNGPDQADTVVGRWAMNGAAGGMGPGYFNLDDPALIVDDVSHTFYVRINSGCCWYTKGYTIRPGMQALNIQKADWTCSKTECFPDPPVPATHPAAPGSEH